MSDIRAYCVGMSELTDHLPATSNLLLVLYALVLLSTRRS